MIELLRKGRVVIFWANASTMEHLQSIPCFGVKLQSKLMLFDFWYLPAETKLQASSLQGPSVTSREGSAPPETVCVHPSSVSPQSCPVSAVTL